MYILEMCMSESSSKGIVRQHIMLIHQILSVYMKKKLYLMACVINTFLLAFFYILTLLYACFILFCKFKSTIYYKKKFFHEKLQKQRTGFQYFLIITSFTIGHKLTSSNVVIFLSYPPKSHILNSHLRISQLFLSFILFCLSHVV